MTLALLFNDLTLGYDRLPAVQNLQAEIAVGSLTAIVGPNGAGKSTLLKGITGSLTPLEGRVSFGAMNREDIAYLPQQSDLDRSFPLSVVDLVAMGLWREIGPFGWLGRERRARVVAAIAAVGLTGFESRAIATLSGGQLQRAFSRGFCCRTLGLCCWTNPLPRSTHIPWRTLSPSYNYGMAKDAR